MTYDDSLFDDLALPDDVDSATLIENICLECAELELLYPDWDFMKAAIKSWSAKELPTWERVAALGALEYNPIENYDRIENAFDSENRKRDNSKTDNITNAARGNSVNSDDNTTRVAGFNGDTLGIQDRKTGSGVSSSDSSGESKQTVTESETDNTGRQHSSRIHGNIGVTTPAQMIESEMELAPKINIYNYIIKSFKRRFCLLVY